jgi:GntR family transcriptional regulator, transcriptional repressor for pyruvate dehydrogenase complex
MPINWSYQMKLCAMKRAISPLIKCVEIIMTVPFKPIKPKRISDQIFDQLHGLIVRGQLKPGEKIMTERELSEALNVSRTSVRDAINRLVVLELLEHRQGQGTFVRIFDRNRGNPVALAMETQDASLADLLEIRMGLECNAAAYAAMRAEEEDIQYLEQTLEEFKQQVESGVVGTEADVSFHMAISHAAKNSLQVYFMEYLYDFLFRNTNENLSQLYQEPGNIGKIQQQHTDVFDAIRRHEPEEAFSAMKRHINFILEFLERHSTS